MQIVANSLSIIGASHWQSVWSRSAFNRDQIARNTWRSRAIRYKPDHDHLHCWSQSCADPALWLCVHCCALHGGEDGSCRSISSQLCIRRADQGVPECTAQQWV